MYKFFIINVQNFQEKQIFYYILADCCLYIKCTYIFLTKTNRLSFKILFNSDLFLKVMKFIIGNKSKNKFLNKFYKTQLKKYFFTNSILHKFLFIFIQMVIKNIC